MKVGSFCAIAAGLLSLSAHAATSFTVIGEAGHPLYDNETVTYTDQQGYFVANAQRYGGDMSFMSTGNLVTVEFSPYDSPHLDLLPYHYDYLFNFAGPGTGPLSVGLFENVAPYPWVDGAQAGMSFYKLFGGCVEGGSFNVLDIAIVDDTLTRLAVDFQYSCVQGPQVWDEKLEAFRLPVAWGSVRYNSDIPPVPLPSTFLMYAGSIGVLLSARRRRAKRMAV